MEYEKVQDAKGYPQHGQEYGMQGQQTCAFAAPPPKQQYCGPAPYSQIYGQRYHLLHRAYGESRRTHY